MPSILLAAIAVCCWLRALPLLLAAGLAVAVGRGLCYTEVAVQDEECRPRGATPMLYVFQRAAAQEMSRHGRPVGPEACDVSV